MMITFEGVIAKNVCISADTFLNVAVIFCASSWHHRLFRSVPFKFIVWFPPGFKCQRSKQIHPPSPVTNLFKCGIKHFWVGLWSLKVNEFKRFKLHYCVCVMAWRMHVCLHSISCWNVQSDLTRPLELVFSINNSAVMDYFLHILLFWVEGHRIGWPRSLLDMDKILLKIHQSFL